MPRTEKRLLRARYSCLTCRATVPLVVLRLPLQHQVNSQWKPMCLPKVTRNGNWLLLTLGALELVQDGSLLSPSTSTKAAATTAERSAQEEAFLTTFPLVDLSCVCLPAMFRLPAERQSSSKQNHTCLPQGIGKTHDVVDGGFSFSRAPWESSDTTLCCPSAVHP